MDDPWSGDLKKLPRGNPAHALVSGAICAMNAAFPQEKTVSPTPRYGAAKNGSEVPIKRGVSPYRPLYKRYERYGWSEET
jgi:hypothetical protein